VAGQVDELLAISFQLVESVDVVDEAMHSYQDAGFLECSHPGLMTKPVD
jgi:hypothetical protein